MCARVTVLLVLLGRRVPCAPRELETSRVKFFFSRWKGNGVRTIECRIGDHSDRRLPSNIRPLCFIDWIKFLSVQARRNGTHCQGHRSCSRGWRQQSRALPETKRARIESAFIGLGRDCLIEERMQFGEDGETVLCSAINSSGKTSAMRMMSPAGWLSGRRHFHPFAESTSPSTGSATSVVDGIYLWASAA